VTGDEFYVLRDTIRESRPLRIKIFKEKLYEI